MKLYWLLPSTLSIFLLSSPAQAARLNAWHFNAKYNKGMAYAGGAVSAQDATKALGDLKKLFDTGVITAEEYEQKRQNLLKSL